MNLKKFIDTLWDLRNKATKGDWGAESTFEDDGYKEHLLIGKNQYLLDSEDDAIFIKEAANTIDYIGEDFYNLEYQIDQAIENKRYICKGIYLDVCDEWKDGYEHCLRDLKRKIFEDETNT